MKENRSKFLFVADDPCLDFLNTQMVDRGEPVDRLEDFRDLVSWLNESGLAALPGAAIRRFEEKDAQLALMEAKKFREALRDMASRLIRRKRVPHAVLKAINHYWSLRKGHPVLLNEQGRFRKQFQERIDSPAELLAPIAEAAANLLCNADFLRIRKCENDKCILYFYDSTKNQARRWCSMTVCGNRNKVAAYYKRLKKSL